MKLIFAIFQVVIALLFIAVVNASDYKVGDQVVLRPTKPIGVPLHHEAKSSLFGRGKEGLCAKVIDLAQEGRWLRLNLNDGRIAWVVSKYVETSPTECEEISPPPPADSIMEQVFQSAQSCNEILSSGRRMPPKPEETIRLATWNIRWFPNGEPVGAPAKPTDLEWLACVLTWLDVDVVAVQEILDTREAESAWDSLSDSLTAKTGQDWSMDLQECGDNKNQHVGFIWNSSRVNITNFQDRWEMNGAAESPTTPCANTLRPGRSAYVKSISGGVDFHIVSVHLDSGRRLRDYRHRKIALSRFDDVYLALQSSERDEDVIIVGDFNTMGHRDDEGLSSQQEILDAKTELASLTPSFALVDPDLGCSEYYDGDCSLLDHFAISKSMREDGEAKDSIPLVTGYCAVNEGNPLDPGSMPSAYKKLSDHCPIIIDIKNEDLD